MLVMPLIRPRSQLLMLVILLLSAGTAFVWICNIEIRKGKPDDSIRTIVDFLDCMPSPQLVREFQFGEEVFVELVGPLPHSITLPSGPPSYVFDGKGELVDWTHDKGDDSTYVKRWKHFQDAKPIPIECALDHMGIEMRKK